MQYVRGTLGLTSQFVQQTKWASKPLARYFLRFSPFVMALHPNSFEIVSVLFTRYTRCASSVDLSSMHLLLIFTGRGKNVTDAQK